LTWPLAISLNWIVVPSPRVFPTRFASTAIPKLLALLVLLSAMNASAGDRLEVLTRALTRDPSWRVRLQAVVVLGKLRDRRAAPALITALDDSNETVRGLAAQVLGDLGDPRAQAALERAQSDASGFVRERAMAALARLSGGDAGGAQKSGMLYVGIGGIGAKAHNTPPELKDRLRDLIKRELAKTPGVTTSGEGSSGYLIDSSITAVSRKATEQFVEISCEVSFVVGRLPSKAVVMMTSGGATVQAPKGSYRHEGSLYADALEGAVQSAHDHLLAFLRREAPSAFAAGRAGRR
jgi:hypothetical protein